MASVYTCYSKTAVVYNEHFKWVKIMPCIVVPCQWKWLLWKSNTTQYWSSNKLKTLNYSLDPSTPLQCYTANILNKPPCISTFLILVHLSYQIFIFKIKKTTKWVNQSRHGSQHMSVAYSNKRQGWEFVAHLSTPKWDLHSSSPQSHLRRIQHYNLIIHMIWYY